MPEAFAESSANVTSGTKFVMAAVYAAIIVSALFFLVSSVEIFTVLYGDTSGYPFGCECGVPSHYATKETYLYANYRSAAGSLAALVGLVWLRHVLQRKSAS